MAVSVKNLQKLDRAKKGNPSLVKPVIQTLVIAAVLELIMWQAFTRIGAFIPKQSTFQSVYDVISKIAVVILNFSVIVAMLSIVLLIGRLRHLELFGKREGRIINKTLTIGIMGFVIALILNFITMALVYNAEVSLVLRLTLLVTFWAFGIDYWQRHQGWKYQVFIGLLLGAYTLQIVAKLVSDELAGRLGIAAASDFYLPILIAGEALVLLNGFGLFMAYGGGGFRTLAKNWPVFVATVVVTGIFVRLTSLTVDGSNIVPILAEYSLGYKMQLPLPFYVIALFFLGYVVFYNLSRIRQGSEYQAAAFGVILIFTGGYFFNVSNQYIFALIGLLLLARPELLEN